MSILDDKQKNSSEESQTAQNVRHAEFAPPYPHNSPNEKELDPLVVTYQSVTPPVVTDGQREIELPRKEI